MIRLGITGGIGSGKSYVARLLAQGGLPVYDTDTEAKRLMLSDADIRAGLISLLGERVYVDEKLNKPLLADYLFASDEHASRINSIVHPCVKRDFLRWAASRAEHEVVALESAILYESGFDDVVDYVVAVYAPLEVRIRRAMERDCATEEQVKSRISSQMNEELKRDRADFVIVNDGRALSPQLDALLKALKNRKGGQDVCVCHL